jgi:hypothetical protein
VRIPAKPNAVSEGKPNGIPGRTRTPSKRSDAGHRSGASNVRSSGTARRKAAGGTMAPASAARGARLIMYRLLDIASLGIFTFGALTFSTLALVYCRERRRNKAHTAPCPSSRWFPRWRSSATWCLRPGSSGPQKFGRVWPSQRLVSLRLGCCLRSCSTSFWKRTKAGLPRSPPGAGCLSRSIYSAWLWSWQGC